MVDTTNRETAGQDSGVIHCLTIPLYEETVLLPNAAIAEIIAYLEPDKIENAPEWFLGFVTWREIQVPLISFEILSGKETQAAKKNNRIAILNTLNGNAQLPYIGILSQGIPSLALVQEEGLEEFDDSDNRATVGAVVKLAGGEAVIPNIDEIEQRLLALNIL
jgi:chemosensory pili system protein ChpC